MSEEKRGRRLLRLPGAEEDPREMGFLEHLEELRWVLIRSGICVVVAMGAMFTVSEWVIQAVLMRPFHIVTADIPNIAIITLRPAGNFLAVLNVSLWAGAIVSVPYVAWEAWRFVAPGLFKHERRLVPWVIVITVLCFAAGAALAYFVVLQFALQFFLTNFMIADPQIEIREYLSFAMRLIFSFGLVFELPVLSFFLARFGIITSEILRKGRSWGYMIIAFFSAFITPPDPFTMLILMGPLILLYEISILVTKMAVRKRHKALP